MVEIRSNVTSPDPNAGYGSTGATGGSGGASATGGSSATGGTSSTGGAAGAAKVFTRDEIAKCMAESGSKVYDPSEPALPPGDQEALAELGGNPFCQCGFLAEMGPIISEMTKLANFTTLVSGQMSVKCMEVITTTADQTFKMGIEIGRTKEKILNADATMQATSAGISFLNAGISAATLAKSTSEIKAKHASIEADAVSQYDKSLSRSGVRTKYEDIPANSTFKTQAESQKISADHEIMQRNGMFSSIGTGLTGTIKESVDAALTAKKAGLSYDEQHLQSVKESIDKLIGLITDALQKAGQMAPEASNMLKGWLEEFKSMAQQLKG